MYQCAKNLRETYELQEKIPLDIWALCEKLEIDIIEIDFTNIEDETTYQVSGIIESEPISEDEKDKKNRKTTIYLNINDIPERKNFTLAHEIGHYIMHIDNDDDGTIVSFRSSKNPREREADRFAVELLMPKNLILKRYNEMFLPTAIQLAKEFGVSKTAMKYRLDEMGLSYIG